jgi:cobalt-zinc-cadmium efflux system outer membrane protein
MGALGAAAGAQTAPAAAPPARLSLEQAIQLALAHSPAMAAVRSLVPQSQANEVTAGLRPNPVLNWDGLYLPIFEPSHLNRSFLNNNAEFDGSVSYTFERGGKRQARIQAARDATTVVRSQVADAGRGLAYAVAQSFVAALLAKSSLAFARRDLSSWQRTVNLSRTQYRAGAISEGDLDTIQLQTLQYQAAVSADRLALAQSLTALRQAIGFSGVPSNFTIAGGLVYQPLHGNLDDMRMLALKRRPDLLEAQQGVTAAQSQYKLAQADGKRDLTTTAQYIHTGGLNEMGFLFSIEIPVFDRNQGEIARTAAAEIQAKDLVQQARQQVLTDVRTAYEAVTEGAKVVGIYTSGYRAEAKQALTIRQYSYRRGATSLLDLLDAERTYRSTELGYRQALAAYMLAIEQLKEAVGSRTLP